LSISETSGLAINDSGTTLWTVTDTPGRVYQLDLVGKMIRKLNYVGEDLEGIAYDPSDRTLWVVEENRREIVHLDLKGDVLSRKQLDLRGKKNSGLEGICLEHEGRMFVLNEKNPGLFIELNPDHSIARQNKLSFAGDYSDVASSRQANCFWILSDESRGLYLWSKRTGVIREYSLPFPKPEGVALVEASHLVYVVSDSENKLYVYRMK